MRQHWRNYLDFYHEEKDLLSLNSFIPKEQGDEKGGASTGSSTPKGPSIISFEKAKEGGLLPEPFWTPSSSENERYAEAAIACYWHTWRLAFNNIKQATTENGFVSNFIDTAFNNCLFMWDSAFILLFARYGCRAFDFQRTLDNFYAKQHPDGFICREIHEWDGHDQFHRYDPVSTGPNVLPWEEWEYFKNFGDIDRVRRVFYPLLAYHRWMRKHRTWPDGSYWTSGLGCGMDNQPRTPPGCSAWVEHGHMAWVDACCQALLSAKVLLRMHHVITTNTAQPSTSTASSVNVDVSDLREEVKYLSEYVNQYLWDQNTGFYHDRRLGRFNKTGDDAKDLSTDVKSIGAYWALLAQIVPKERLLRFVGHLLDSREFNTPNPVPSLSRDHPDFAEDGGYWRGGVWPSTNYMVLRGLTLNGFDELAHEISSKHHSNVVRVYQSTGTVWENYSPTAPTPGNPAKPDFVGWGGLGPIAVFIEYIIGLRADVPRNVLVWDVHLLDVHGVNNYPYGPKGVVLLLCEARQSADEEPQVVVESNIALSVEVRWAQNKKSKIIQVEPTVG
jgi:hypothetical protein